MFDNIKSSRLLIVFIIVALFNLLVHNLLISFICSSVFLILSLKHIIQFSNRNIEMNSELKRQALIYNGIIFIISIFWFLAVIIMFLAVSALLSIIKGLVIWILSYIKDLLII